MELHERIDSINTKEDLADFIETLRLDLLSNQDDWENPSLERFLEAMSAWIHAMENNYINIGKQFPVQPSWKVFADILYASKIYE